MPEPILAYPDPDHIGVHPLYVQVVAPLVGRPGCPHCTAPLHLYHDRRLLSCAACALEWVVPVAAWLPLPGRVARVVDVEVPEPPVFDTAGVIHDGDGTGQCTPGCTGCDVEPFPYPGAVA